MLTVESFLRIEANKSCSGNVNQEEEKERCFRDGYAQGVEDSKKLETEIEAKLRAEIKAESEAKLEETKARYERHVKGLRAEKDELSAKWQAAQLCINKPGGLIPLKRFQRITRPRAEIARPDQDRRDQEALGEQQSIVTQQEEKIQLLTAQLQAEQAAHQASRDYANQEWGKLCHQASLDKQKMDQLQREVNEAVQGGNQALQERDWAVQELSKAKQELDQALQNKDQALQQVLKDRQVDQATLDDKCAQLQQELAEANSERDDIMQKCREALQQKDHALKLAQQARENGEAIRDNDYYKLQQKLDQAIEARDQAVKERDLAMQKMTEALQERDEVLQEKDRDLQKSREALQEKDLALQKSLEALQQEHQGRMEDRAQWNSMHTGLVRERDWAVQELDRVTLESDFALREKDISMQQLKLSHLVDEDRWESEKFELQEERNDLAAELSRRRNASEERQTTVGEDPLDDEGSLFVPRDDHEACRERIAELERRNAALNEEHEQAENSKQFVEKTLAELRQLRMDNRTLTQRVEFFEETYQKDGSAEATHSYCEKRIAELESGKKKAESEASQFFAQLFEAQNEKHRLNCRILDLENPNRRSGLRGVRAETDRIHRRTTAATSTQRPKRSEPKAKVNTGMLAAMLEQVNIAE